MKGWEFLQEEESVRKEEYGTKTPVSEELMSSLPVGPDTAAEEAGVRTRKSSKTLSEAHGKGGLGARRKHKASCMQKSTSSVLRVNCIEAREMT